MSRVYSGRHRNRALALPRKVTGTVQITKAMLYKAMKEIDEAELEIVYLDRDFTLKLGVAKKRATAARERLFALISMMED